jgi:hypothetical protein
MPYSVHRYRVQLVRVSRPGALRVAETHLRNIIYCRGAKKGRRGGGEEKRKSGWRYMDVRGARTRRLALYQPSHLRRCAVLGSAPGPGRPPTSPSAAAVEIRFFTLAFVWKRPENGGDGPGITHADIIIGTCLQSGLKLEILRSLRLFPSLTPIFPVNIPHLL